MVKDNIGENLLRYSFKKHNFVIFDYETENLNLAINNRPWEIGYIVVEGDKIVKEENVRILWKDLNISDDAARITRFNQEEYLKTAQDPEKVLSEFEGYLMNDKYINISYNGLNFDFYLHNLYRTTLGKPINWSFLSRSIDMLTIIRAWRLNMSPPSTLEEFICWQVSLANYKNDLRLRAARKGAPNTLSSASKELGVSVQGENWHSGLYDVKVTWEVFKKMIWKMEVEDLWK